MMILKSMDLLTKIHGSSAADHHLSVHMSHDIPLFALLNKYFNIDLCFYLHWFLKRNVMLLHQKIERKKPLIIELEHLSSQHKLDA